MQPLPAPVSCIADCDLELIVCLPLPTSVGIKNAWHQSQYMRARNGTQGVLHARQAFYQLGHILRPDAVNFIIPEING